MIYKVISFDLIYKLSKIMLYYDIYCRLFINSNIKIIKYKHLNLNLIN